MNNVKELTQEYLKKILKYSSTTGKLIWLTNMKNNKVKNKEAGTITQYGYVQIRINNKLYLGHRLIWLHQYGVWPKNHIDHINGIRNDNRIENLREATSRDNNLNRGIHRKGHLAGTSFHKRDKKWNAKIVINGQSIYLGAYNTPLEAHLAYMLKKRN